MIVSRHVTARPDGLDHQTKCVAAEEARNATYAVRHWKLAPERPIEDRVAIEIVRLLARDLLFDPKLIEDRAGTMEGSAR